jgi:hypothetical protein
MLMLGVVDEVGTVLLTGESAFGYQPNLYTRFIGYRVKQGMARPKLTPEEREKRRIKQALTRNFFMEALRREDA